MTQLVRINLLYFQAKVGSLKFRCDTIEAVFAIGLNGRVGASSAGQRTVQGDEAAQGGEDMVCASPFLALFLPSGDTGDLVARLAQLLASVGVELGVLSAANGDSR